MYEIFRSDTGQRVTAASYFTRESAEADIAFFVRRDERGGRPDCHEMVPFLEVRESDASL